MSEISAYSIKDGSFHVLIAFDVGFEIRVAQIPALFPSRISDPVGYNFLDRSFGRDTRPLRLVLDPFHFKISGRLREFQVYASFFDVGALSLELICELDDPINELPALALEAQGSEELIGIAKQLAETLFQQAKPAIVAADFFSMPSIIKVFNIRKLNPKASAETIKTELGTLIAKTLRLSDEPIGRAEIERTLNPSITYSDDDIVFMSSNVAVVFDETSSDVVDVFELLNVQSLELRFIDAKLDRTLVALYEETEEQPSWISRLFNLFDDQSRRLNTIHLDSTVIVERVEQSYKFANDSYLVRIYELCVNKMFLQSFSIGIDKKLQAIREVITDQRDRATTIRMEFLEWIVIILIAADVVPKIFSIFR